MASAAVGVSSLRAWPIHPGVWQQICHRGCHAMGRTPRDCYPRSRDSRRPDITGRRSSVDGLHRGISLEDRRSLGGSGRRRRLTRGDGLPPHERTEQKQHALISISSTRVTKLSEALADPVAEPGAPHQSASMIAMGSFYTNGAKSSAPSRRLAIFERMMGAAAKTGSCGDSDPQPHPVSRGLR